MGKIYGTLNLYLNTLVTKIIEDETLCKFLYYEQNCDVVSQPNLTEEQKAFLLKDRIFVSKKVPIIQNKGKPLLIIRAVDIDYADDTSTTIDNIRLSFYTICDIGVLETENGARDVCISTALDKLLLQSKNNEVGYGKIKRWKIQDLAGLGEEFQGYVNSYEISQINPRYLGVNNGN